MSAKYPSDGWWSWPFVGGHSITVELKDGYIVATTFMEFDERGWREWYWEAAH